MTTTYVKCKIVRVKGRLITKATAGSAGWDVYSAESGMLRAGERKLFSAGIQLEIPEGFEGVVRPRSGLATKHGVTIVNSPGTIDSDYRGEVFIGLINLSSDKDYSVCTGDRIAQIVFQRVANVSVVEVSEISSSERGEGGFGSTGK